MPIAQSVLRAQRRTGSDGSIGVDIKVILSEQLSAGIA